MKRLSMFLCVAALSLPLVLSAQTSESSWRKTEDPGARKNSITVLGSVQGWGKYHSWGFGHVGLEFDRALPHNLSVSAIGLYAPMNSNSVDDGYAQEEEFSFAGVKINYNLPVVRGWLWLRFGLGGGVGWHKTTGYELGWNLNNISAPALDTYVKPHLMVDAWWVLRAARWLDLRFSPLVISPSQLIVGGKHNAPYNDSMFRYFNMGALGATVRF